MNKKQQNPEHQHNAHAGPHEEDNCGGCQAERHQNRRLVEFYERLQKIEGRVGVIKQNVSQQQQARNQQKEQMSKMQAILVSSPQKALQQINQQNPKQMGYELASALIERQLKAKMEHKRLQQIIEQLQKDKLKLEEENKLISTSKLRDSASPTTHSEATTHFYQKDVPSRYGDVLDEVRRTNSIDSSYFTGKKKNKNDMNNSYFAEHEEFKKYWETSEGHSQTSFSNFSAPTKQQPTSRASDKSQYEGLNLWLYQYKTQDMDENPIKSLRKPSRNIQKQTLGKYKSKF